MAELKRTHFAITQGDERLEKQGLEGGRYSELQWLTGAGNIWATEHSPRPRASEGMKTYPH